MRDLDRFLDEDLGPHGDVTTRAVFGAKRRNARARIFARERLLVAGIPEATDIFRRLRVMTKALVGEGNWANAEATLLELRGPLSGILAGERVALNLIGRMSGIATTTRRLQDRVTRVNPSCRVAGTRKTTPGFRSFEKRAIAIGGGDPHRFGLYDGILIKDNHLAAARSIRNAVERAKRARPRFPIEVEVSNVASAVEAAEAGADWLLIDNLSPAGAKRVASAARKARPGILIESSGGLTPRSLTQFAPFSDRLSLGRLTHSAASADVSLELVRT